MRALCSATVDFKPDLVLQRDQTDGSSAGSEVLDVADGEQVHVLCGRENYSQIFFLRRADEENVARRRLLHICEAADQNLLALNTRAGDGGVKHRTEWIFAQNTDFENVRGCSPIARPRHKLAKVVEIRGVNLNCGRPRILRKTVRCGQKQEKD